VDVVVTLEVIELKGIVVVEEPDDKVDDGDVVLENARGYKGPKKFQRWFLQDVGSSLTRSGCHALKACGDNAKGCSMTETHGYRLVSRKTMRCMKRPCVLSQRK
jgi:hypothetical protein